jgi:hypothetical protein
LSFSGSPAGIIRSPNATAFVGIVAAEKIRDTERK